MDGSNCTKVPNLVAQFTEQNANFLEENARFRKEETALVQCVSERERRLTLNDGNSSRPPSSDGPEKPTARGQRTRSPRDTSIRKSGDQPGHPGATLKQVENPDKITNRFPNQCQTCQAVLSPQEAIRSAGRQVFFLAPPSPIVSWHCAHLPMSILRHAIPSRLSRKSNIPARYGDEIGVLAANLQAQHGIPEDLVAQVFCGCLWRQHHIGSAGQSDRHKTGKMNSFAETVESRGWCREFLHAPNRH